MSSMKSAAAKFFSLPTFAVAGASSNTSKFGHRIFAWYLDHNLSALPLNPTIPTVSVSNKDYETYPSPSKLPDPKRTALSVITPPPVTAKLLIEAKESGVPAVWLQPGAFTEKELQYALENFPGAAVGGFAEGTRGHEGWCVLVDGDQAIAAAKKMKRQVSPPNHCIQSAHFLTSARTAGKASSRKAKKRVEHKIWKSRQPDRKAKGRIKKVV